MPSSLPSIPDNIVETTAPLILGALFTWCLYGMLSIQVYIYHLNFPEDRPSVKRLVYGTYFIETAQITFSTTNIFYWFSSGFGDVNRLAEVHTSPWSTPLLCGFIALIVQCFFAHRIWLLRRSFWISVLILLISLIQTIGAVGITIQAYLLGTFDRVSKTTVFPTMWLLGDTICDILIAGSMLHIFFKFKTEEFRHTNRILSRLTRLILETNALTASMALLSFILFVRFPNNNFFVCPTLVMGKLYSNTLLITLNNRLAIRRVDNATFSSNWGARGHSPFGTLRWATGSNTSSSRSEHGVKFHDIENTELELLRPEKAFDNLSLPGCHRRAGCWGCCASTQEVPPFSDTPQLTDRHVMSAECIIIT